MGNPHPLPSNDQNAGNLLSSDSLHFSFSILSVAGDDCRVVTALNRTDSDIAEIQDFSAASYERLSSVIGCRAGKPVFCESCMRQPLQSETMASGA